MAESPEQQQQKSHKGEQPLTEAVEFTVSREFEAPRELVYKVHRQEEHLQRWWGPKGCATAVLNLDFRPGGEYRYSMKAPGQEEPWYGKLKYVNMREPTEMTYIVSFNDEKGNDIKHPLSPTWPMYLKSVVSFSETADGKKTLVEMRTVPYEASEEEIKTFNQGLKPLRLGCEGSFDQLRDYLTTVHDKAEPN